MKAAETSVVVPSTPPSDLPPRVQPMRPPREPRPLPSTEATHPPEAHDRVELSSAVQELSAAAAAASAADAERTELVLRLRRQIAEGAYEPDAEAVARALLARLDT